MNSEERAEALLLAEELMADIELDRTDVDKQALKASRLARLCGDEKVLTWLTLERLGYSKQDANGYYWEASRRGAVNEADRIFAGAIHLGPLVRTLEAELENMKLPNLSGDYVTIAIRETREHIARIRNQVLRYKGVLSSVSMLIHDFAARQYYALKFTLRQDGLFDRAKKSIDSLLVSLDAEAVRKIDAAQANLAAGDAESIAAAMLNVRRLIDSFADAVFPPTKETRTNGQGQQVKLGSEQRLNRVKAYIDDNTTSETRTSRLKRAIGDIYGRVSTGVHNDVTLSEAEYLFLATYVLLGEILSSANEKVDDTSTVEIP